MSEESSKVTNVRDFVLNVLKYEGTTKRGKYVFSFGEIPLSYLRKNPEVKAEIKKHPELYVRYLEDPKSFMDEVESAIFKIDKERAAQEREDRINAIQEVGESGGRSKTQIIASLEVYIKANLTSESDAFIFVSRDNRYVGNIHPSVVATAKGTNTEALREIAAKDHRYGYVEYSPFKPQRVYNSQEDGEKHGLYVINSYNPPCWMNQNARPKYQGFIRKFMEHLFPFEDDRNYVLNWLRQMLLKRNDTYLCLIGYQGSGKTFLFSEIVRALVGQQNYGLGSKGTFRNTFNSVIVNKRFVFFDEVPLDDPEAIDRAKAMTDDMVNTEAKGKDEEMTPNYASFGMANNFKNKFQFEPSERKFSTPVVTKKSLLKTFTLEEIRQFKDCCDAIAEGRPFEDLTLAEFGFYLTQETPPEPLTDEKLGPLKNDYFYEICFESLPRWKSELIKDFLKLGAGAVVSGIDIFKIVKNSSPVGGMPKSNKVQEFLEGYRHYDQEFIGQFKPVDYPKKSGKVTAFDFQMTVSKAFVELEEQKKAIRNQRNKYLDDIAGFKISDETAEDFAGTQEQIDLNLDW